MFWWLFVIPTALLSIDYIITTAAAGQTSACVHHLAVLLWVVGNACWAYGDIFSPYPGDDTYPAPLWEARWGDDGSPHSYTHGRWIAVWVLLSAVTLLFFFHILWIALTLHEAFLGRSTTTVVATGFEESKRSKAPENL